MRFSDMNFVRKFSLNLRKNLSVPLSKMSFTSDFTNTARGNLYPVISRSESARESVVGDRYTVTGGRVERMVCSFFPFATYRISAEHLSGAVGFAFVSAEARCDILLENDEWSSSVLVSHKDCLEKTSVSRELDGGFSLIVTARPGAFDIYTEIDSVIRLVKTVHVPSFAHSNKDSFYSSAKTHVILSGNVTISSMDSCVDCGISQADVRPFRYENGEIIMENGRIFIAFSARMQQDGYQGVLSWVPGTTDFRMEGAIFYDCGDGIARAEVATAYVFDRREQTWYMWQRNVGGGHVLAKTSFKADVRYGVNVLDVTPLPLMSQQEMDDRKLLGKRGDEDPDFMYDEERGKWLLSICRLAEDSKKYQYFFFESDRPLDGYVCVGCGKPGEETGGTIVKLDGKVYFICGNGFKLTSNYRVYEWGNFDEFETLRADYPDGGFRGWGTVMPINIGTRCRYYWLTFDRMLMSDIHNWSYGNLYCFEAEGIFHI